MFWLQQLSVDGLQYPDGCLLKRHIPILGFHGKADQTNHYVLSETQTLLAHGSKTAIDKVATGQCMFDEKRCRSNIPGSHFLPMVRLSWCWRNQFYVTENGGHPGQALMTMKNINTSELIWKFFSQHSLP